jgi:hypothetical protein
VPDDKGPVWVQLLPLVPALLAPVITWYLSQRGTALRAQRFEHLLRRAELAGKLRALEPDANDPLRRKALTDEINDILDDLAALRASEQAPSAAAVPAISIWNQFWLRFPQSSLKGRIYKGLFYSFFGFGLLGLAVLPFGTPGAIDLTGVVPAAVLYVGIALLFRSAATREYKRKVAQREARTLPA